MTSDNASGDGRKANAEAPVALRLEPAAFSQWIRGWLPNDGFASEDGDGAEWRLDDVHRFGPWELVLRWVYGDRSKVRRVSVRLRDDRLPAAARTEQLDVLHKMEPSADLEDRKVHDNLGRFAERFAAALGRHESTVRFQGVRANPTHRANPEGPPPAFNLAVPGNCAQKCTFCGIREAVKVANQPGEPLVRQLFEDVSTSAAAGTKVLRVNGIEPLAAPYIWDLLDHAKAAGFTEFHVLSTFRPIRTAEQARRLLDAMPQRYRLYIPLYGSRAEIHDAVTAVPGSFDEIMATTTLLREEMVRRGELDGRGQLMVTTVLMRANLGDMHAMAMLVRPLARTWELHLAFPNTGSRYDPYPTIAVSMTEALEAVAPATSWAAGELPLGEVTPCVAWRHQRATGHPLLGREQIARRRKEPSGTYYESAGFSHSLAGGKEVAFTAATVPCPHAEQCALAELCPKKVYAAYGAVFGLDELIPVSDVDLH